MSYDYIQKEWKKLGGVVLMGVGAFLTIEHTLTYGGIDLFDFFGHEVLGIILFLAGVLVANRWGRLKFLDGIKYAKEKLRYVFNG